MKAASGAPAQEDRQVAGVGFSGSRRQLGLQEDFDEVGSLAIGEDGDRIGSHAIRIRRRGRGFLLVYRILILASTGQTRERRRHTGLSDAT